MTIHRKQFLQGTSLAVGGASLGYLGREFLQRYLDSLGVPAPPIPQVARPAAAPVAGPSEAELGWQGEPSFSQAGEDMVVKFVFQYLGIKEVTYLDVGANDPVNNNNTYFFYRKGYKGVLVEPNVAYTEQLRSVRPRDTTLAAGIGFAAAKEADYYVMTQDALNTFSKEEADHQVKASKGEVAIKEVVKVPLLSINDVMGEHFKGAPAFLSIDTEGLDLAILKSIDYGRFRPKVICAETLFPRTTRTRPEIAEFLATQGYVARGGSLVNTVFVDSKIL
jgi:FkbM family methyltransferase